MWSWVWTLLGMNVCILEMHAVSLTEHFCVLDYHLLFWVFFFPECYSTRYRSRINIGQRILPAYSVSIFFFKSLKKKPAGCEVNKEKLDISIRLPLCAMLINFD